MLRAELGQRLFTALLPQCLRRIAQTLRTQQIDLATVHAEHLVMGGMASSGLVCDRLIQHIKSLCRCALFLQPGRVQREGIGILAERGIAAGRKTLQSG